MLIRGKPATALKVRFRDGVLEIAPKDAQTDLKLFRRHEEVEAAYQAERRADYVVDVLCPDGSVRLFTTDELRKINESR